MPSGPGSAFSLYSMQSIVISSNCSASFTKASIARRTWVMICFGDASGDSFSASSMRPVPNISRAASPPMASGTPSV